MNSCAMKIAQLRHRSHSSLGLRGSGRRLLMECATASLLPGQALEEVELAIPKDGSWRSPVCMACTEYSIRSVDWIECIKKAINELRLETFASKKIFMPPEIVAKWNLLFHTIYVMRLQTQHTGDHLVADASRAAKYAVRNANAASANNEILDKNLEALKSFKNQGFAEILGELRVIWDKIKLIRTSMIDLDNEEAELRQKIASHITERTQCIAKIEIKNKIVKVVTHTSGNYDAISDFGIDFIENDKEKEKQKTELIEINNELQSISEFVGKFRMDLFALEKEKVDYFKQLEKAAGAGSKSENPKDSDRIENPLDAQDVIDIEEKCVLQSIEQVKSGNVVQDDFFDKCLKSGGSEKNSFSKTQKQVNAMEKADQITRDAFMNQKMTRKIYLRALNKRMTNNIEANDLCNELIAMLVHCKTKEEGDVLGALLFELSQEAALAETFAKELLKKSNAEVNEKTKTFEEAATTLDKFDAEERKVKEKEAEEKEAKEKEAKEKKQNVQKKKKERKRSKRTTTSQPMSVRQKAIEFDRKRREALKNKGKKKKPDPENVDAKATSAPNAIPVTSTTLARTTPAHDRIEINFENPERGVLQDIANKQRDSLQTSKTYERRLEWAEKIARAKSSDIARATLHCTTFKDMSYVDYFEENGTSESPEDILKKEEERIRKEEEERKEFELQKEREKEEAAARMKKREEEEAKREQEKLKQLAEEQAAREKAEAEAREAAERRARLQKEKIEKAKELEKQAREAEERAEKAALEAKRKAEKAEAERKQAEIEMKKQMERAKAEAEERERKANEKRAKAEAATRAAERAAQLKIEEAKRREEEARKKKMMMKKKKKPKPQATIDHTKAMNPRERAKLYDKQRRANEEKKKKAKDLQRKAAKLEKENERAEAQLRGKM
eukprot:g6542.t1